MCKRKFRFLLVCSTVKRDFGMLYVLSQLLRHMGHDAHVIPLEFSHTRWTKLYHPDAVFSTTAGKLKGFFAAFPYAQFYLCAGEGGGCYKYFGEGAIVKDPTVLRRLKRVFPWGTKGHQHLERYISENSTGDTCEELQCLLKERSRVMGHPRLDITSYACSIAQKATDKTRIGFIGSAHLLNFSRGTSALVSLLDDPERAAPMHHMIDQVKLYMDIIASLPHEKYSFSIRPYPQESVEQYQAAIPVASGLLSVDKHIDMGSWLANVDIVVGGFSTTVAQVIPSGKRYVNTSKVVTDTRNPEIYNHGLAESIRQSLDASCPPTFSSLLEILRAPPENPDYPKELLSCLDSFYSTDMGGSALLRIAADMQADLLQSPPPRRRAFLPYSLADRINDARVATRSYSYTYFRTADVRQQAMDELDPIARAIVNDPANQHLLTNTD